MQHTRFAQVLFPTLLLTVAAPSFATNVDDDGWHVSVSPYLWAVDMNGYVEIAGVREAINQTFGDALKQFKGGGMLRMDAEKNKLGIFADVLYVSLSQQILPQPTQILTHNKLGIASVGISYEVFKKKLGSPDKQIKLAPYLGARFTLNNASISASGLDLNNNVRWTDPIIGAGLTYDFNKSWQAIVTGDVGGTNVKKDESYDVMGLLGYKLNSHLKLTTLYFGYQMLYQKYITGHNDNQFAWNMKLFGPMVGFSIKFS